MNRVIGTSLAIIIIVICAVLASGLVVWQSLKISEEKEEISEEMLPGGEIPEELAGPLELNLETTKLTTINYDDKMTIFYIDQLTFSPDGKQLAYVVREMSDRWFVVINNRREKVYEDAHSFVFSPDSKNLAYKAQKKRETIYCS